MIMRNDVLLDVATFLARRWSGNSRIVISIMRDMIPTARPEKGQIVLPIIDYFSGTDFQKYRQWRVALWYESMRIMHSSKVLSYDHAYGFLLNTVEKKRIEFLGLLQWQGMVKEIIFNESIFWLSCPLLNSLYGRHKVVEAFSQYFLTGYIKGELFGSEFERVKTSAEFANGLVDQAIKNNYGTDWIERHIPKLIKMLEIDPLVSIPIIAPRTRIGLSINRSDLLKQIENVLSTTTKYKPDEIDSASKKVAEGTDVLNEFKTLLNESTKTENKGYESLENLGLSIPKRLDLHDKSGEEFDSESYAEMLAKPFLTDVKLSMRTKVAILLDHSSSIEDIELQYKQATIALCEALYHLGVKFAVYAFSTEARQVKCWIIKPLNIKWSTISARRLAQIKASGGTPLAEIYGLLLPITKSFKPEIMVTLTDGEPSDSSAVREMVLSYRKMGINMVGLGVGRNLNDSVAIAHNLKYLNYEKTLAVSRLQDIPKKVINLLRV